MERRAKAWRVYAIFSTGCFCLIMAILLVLTSRDARHWGGMMALAMGFGSVFGCLFPWMAASNAAGEVRRDELYRATGLDRMDTMTGVEFEQFVAAVYRGLGFDVTATATTGDFGIDLIARRGNVKTAIQCKRLGRPIGVSAVQQAVSGRDYYNCTSAAVVGNWTFTAAAQKLARVHRCELIDRTKLERLVSEQQPQRRTV